MQARRVLAEPVVVLARGKIVAPDVVCAWQLLVDPMAMRANHAFAEPEERV